MKTFLIFIAALVGVSASAQVTNRVKALEANFINGQPVLYSTQETNQTDASTVFDDGTNAIFVGTQDILDEQLTITAFCPTNPICWCSVIIIGIEYSTNGVTAPSVGGVGGAANPFGSIVFATNSARNGYFTLTTAASAATNLVNWNFNYVWSRSKK